MGIAEVARRILPADTFTAIARAKKRFERAKVERLPPLGERDFTEILAGDLRLGKGDTVFVHSSIDRLHLDFPFYRILSLIRDVIGERGTVLFPTYPNHLISSYEYLSQGNVFDVRRTPSYIGLLTEFARRQREAVRSLHPTKSVCAIGPNAAEMTATHQNSPYPYDRCSPYYKLTECEGKIIGLGVWTKKLSFTYCVDDAFKNKGPVQTYYPQTFAARCINYKGETKVVETYAHKMRVVDAHDVPAYMKRHVSGEACSDLVIKGMKFFRADAPRLFDEMLGLAKQGITVYSRSVYSKEWLKANGKI
ncbi:MAG TPA: AAC(3) family N-acetyltransferase [Pyrinomonadaceae bacterium]|nr:AAC(3) family N-acetyltransferase [Pyrinomonadaceae bacterium]